MILKRLKPNQIMSIKVSIDASGGDFGLPVTINAGINALKIYDDLLVNFVGDQTGIEKELSLIHI